VNTLEPCPTGSNFRRTKETPALCRVSRLGPHEAPPHSKRQGRHLGGHQGRPAPAAAPGRGVHQWHSLRMPGRRGTKGWIDLGRVRRCPGTQCGKHPLEPRGFLNFLHDGNIPASCSKTDQCPAGTHGGGWHRPLFSGPSSMHRRYTALILFRNLAETCFSKHLKNSNRGTMKALQLQCFFSNSSANHSYHAMVS
jgi:hypothetical protein